MSGVTSAGVIVFGKIRNHTWNQFGAGTQGWEGMMKMTATKVVLKSES